MVEPGYGSSTTEAEDMVHLQLCRLLAIGRHKPGELGASLKYACCRPLLVGRSPSHEPRTYSNTIAGGKLYLL